ncbi:MULTISPECIES: serine/threonine-protein kinase [unclassified Streptomyces]|uniref:serine/threonine-protein kinase n=1 Tax=unclassified Streptomyces TaxID=2593676 RepID=UPI0013A69CDB|nr:MULTISPECIES: serine/threonine-protein kinase [unclassified Streptomyces]
MTGRAGRPGALAVPRGYRVGPWVAGRLLGSGAFGSVYAALRAVPEPGLPGRAALKVLPTGTSTPRQLRHLGELAARETEVLRRVRTPRLIRMYEVLTVDDPDRPELDGATVLVLEEAAGSLDTLLAGGVPPAGPVLLAQVCEGLDQLHRAGWVHGDLKPGNVLLMPDGSARLGDFNMAAELEGTHAYAAAFATPDYTPPDLLWSEVGERGTKIRPTADIWAFGVLAHVVLTGTLPLPGGTPAARRDAALRYARGEEELRLSPELPAPWRDIVHDCLARRHEDRVRHTAASLLCRARAAATARAEGTYAPPAPRDPVPQGPVPQDPVPQGPDAQGRGPRSPLPRRRRRALIAAAAAAGALAGLGVVWGSGLLPLAGDGTTGYDRCRRGAVCFFAREDGRGEMCSWVDGDTDWTDAPAPCPWAASGAPRSVYNNGFDLAEGAAKVDVRYYGQAGERQLLGCVKVRTRTNLGGGESPRSHAWVPSC